MKPRRFLPVILALAAAMRVGFFAAVRPWEDSVQRQIVLTSDALGYHRLAVNLLEHARLALEATGPSEALRTPAYPAAVAAVYALCGPRPWVVLLLQAALDTATCALLYLLVARSLGARAAGIASLFYAVDPLLVLYSCRLLSDTAFVFLCTAGTGFLIAAFRAGGRRRWGAMLALAGLTWGLAALTRPVAAAVPVVAIIALAVALRGRWPALLGGAAVFAGAFVLTVGPWVVRNRLAFGVWGLSTSSDYNLLVLHAVPVVRERRAAEGSPDVSAEQVKRSLLAEADARAAGEGRRPEDMNPFRKARYQRAVAWDHLRRSPALSCKHYLLGVAHMLVNLGTAEYAEMLRLPRGEAFHLKEHGGLLEAADAWRRAKSGPEIAIGAAVGIVLSVTYVLAGIALAFGWRTGRRTFLFTCLLMGLYFVLITGTAGLARFKLPAVPFYLPFAAAGAERLAERRKT